jgi:hypothetical protein
VMASIYFRINVLPHLGKVIITVFSPARL